VANHLRDQIAKVSTMWIKPEDKASSYAGEDTCFPDELPEEIAAVCQIIHHS
jgi:hypothetical protein